MLFFNVFTIKVQNFTKAPFEKNIPYFIYPYTSKDNNLLSHFSAFEEFVLEDQIATSSINCFKYAYICSKYHFVPGKISISFPPHTNKIYPSSIKLDPETFQEIRSRVLYFNLLNFTSQEEIFAAAQKKPLFLLVARANAGDLEHKLPMIQDLAIKFVHKDITFGFVTVPYIYEQFSNYPLTSFVSIKAVPPLSISPSNSEFDSDSFPKKLEHITFRGDFIIESLAEFVFNNAQVAWGPRRLTSRIGISYVGKSVPSNIVELFIPFMTEIPLIFENISDSSLISSGLCQSPDTECLVIADYRSYRSIVIDQNNSLNTEIINDYISNFDQLWNEKPFIQRFKSRMYFFISTNFSSFLSFGILLSVFVFGISFIHNDKFIQYQEDNKNKRKSQ